MRQIRKLRKLSASEIETLRKNPRVQCGPEYINEFRQRALKTIDAQQKEIEALKQAIQQITAPDQLQHQCSEEQNESAAGGG